MGTHVASPSSSSFRANFSVSLSNFLGSTLKKIISRKKKHNSSASEYNENNTKNLIVCLLSHCATDKLTPSSVQTPSSCLVFSPLILTYQKTIKQYVLVKLRRLPHRFRRRTSGSHFRGTRWSHLG